MPRRRIGGIPLAEPPRRKACPTKSFSLPPRHADNRRVFSYLRGRGIDPEIINHCIKHGLLYESAQHHNCVFVGFAGDRPAYAMQRGTLQDKRFVGEVVGSDKRYSFGISAEAQSDTLNLFESAVDLLSYGTMQKLDGKDWRGENLLSLAGVYKPRAKIEESSLPAALVQYLADYPHIRKAVLRLDNDYTGRIAADTIKTLLSQRYAVKVAIQPPPQGKDYNDCLCMRLGLPVTKRKERSKER